jgi:hypothetical protein
VVQKRSSRYISDACIHATFLSAKKGGAKEGTPQLPGGLAHPRETIGRPRIMVCSGECGSPDQRCLRVPDTGEPLRSIGSPECGAGEEPGICAYRVLHWKCPISPLKNSIRPCVRPLHPMAPPAAQAGVTLTRRIQRIRLDRKPCPRPPLLELDCKATFSTDCYGQRRDAGTACRESPLLSPLPRARTCYGADGRKGGMSHLVLRLQDIPDAGLDDCD